MYVEGSSIVDILRSEKFQKSLDACAHSLSRRFAYEAGFDVYRRIGSADPLFTSVYDHRADGSNEESVLAYREDERRFQAERCLTLMDVDLFSKEAMEPCLQRYDAFCLEEYTHPSARPIIVRGSIGSTRGYAVALQLTPSASFGGSSTTVVEHFESVLRGRRKQLDPKRLADAIQLPGVIRSATLLFTPGPAIRARGMRVRNPEIGHAFGYSADMS